MKYSSEALKKGIKPAKDVKDMTPEELKAFRTSVDPDSMGFDGQEGMIMGGESNG